MPEDRQGVYETTGGYWRLSGGRDNQADHPQPVVIVRTLLILTIYQIRAVRTVHQMVLERVLPRMIGTDGRDGALIDSSGLLLLGGLGHGDERGGGEQYVSVVAT